MGDLRAALVCGDWDEYGHDTRWYALSRRRAPAHLETILNNAYQIYSKLASLSRLLSSTYETMYPWKGEQL